MKKSKFFVVGAQKSGTTSINEWLKKNKYVSLPDKKETNFFSDPHLHSLGLNWYEKQFSLPWNKADAAGEIDPEYMFSEKAPKLIHDVFPDAKIIFILREPLARAYSHYLMTKRRGRDDLSFSEAILAEKKRCFYGDIHSLRDHSYVARGLYAIQVKRYMELFPKENLLFLKFDDLFNEKKTKKLLNNLCSFIEVKACFKNINFSFKANQASDARSKMLFKILSRQSWVRRMAKKCIPSPKLRRYIEATVDKYNRKPLKGAQEIMFGSVAMEVSSFIHEVFMEDIEVVQKITKLDLNDWIEFHRNFFLKKTASTN